MSLLEMSDMRELDTPGQTTCSKGRAAADSFQGEKIIPEEIRHFQVWTRCARKEERDWWKMGRKKRDEVL